MTNSPRIGLATCRSLRPGECDDEPLKHAFRARGCVVEEPVWDDPSVEWATFDITLIRTTWDYVARYREFVDWANRVESLCPLLNPASVVRWNVDKRYLRTLESAGVATIPTLWIEPHAELDANAAVAWLRNHSTDGRCFVKPSVGATASGTLRAIMNDRNDNRGGDGDSRGRGGCENGCENGCETTAGLKSIVAHIDQLHADGHAAMLQPYLGSVETLGERSAILIDGQLSHAVSKRPIPGDYRVQDDWGGSDSPHVPTRSELNFIASVIDALTKSLAAAGTPLDDALTYARVDWLEDARHEPRLVELELIEPSLFFRHHPNAADFLAEAVLRRLPRSRSPISIPSPARDPGRSEQPDFT